MNTLPKVEYYLYRHIREDTGDVFYIGFGTSNPKGRTKKTRYSRAFYKSGRTVFWKNIVSKTKYQVEIFFRSNNLKLTTDKEIEFIKIYKRKCDGGLLVNFSTGGESGASGAKMPEEKVRKHSEFLKEFWKTRLPSASKEIYQYDYFGNLINKCQSIGELARKCNLHLATLKSRIRNSKKSKHDSLKTGFIYSYTKLSEKDLLNIMARKKASVRKVDEKYLRYRDIKQKTKNGTTIKTWNTLFDVDKDPKYNRTLVYCCLRGEAKSHRGFIWSLD